MDTYSWNIPPARRWHKPFPWSAQQTTRRDLFEWRPHYTGCPAR